MGNKEDLEFVKTLMRRIDKNWKESEVLRYDSKLSFDELLAEIEGIHLK